jgi:hypothetical protein
MPPPLGVVLHANATGAVSTPDESGLIPTYLLGFRSTWALWSQPPMNRGSFLPEEDRGSGADSVVSTPDESGLIPIEPSPPAWTFCARKVKISRSSDGSYSAEGCHPQVMDRIGHGLTPESTPSREITLISTSHHGSVHVHRLYPDESGLIPTSILIILSVLTLAVSTPDESGLIPTSHVYAMMTQRLSQPPMNRGSFLPRGGQR